MPRDFKDKGLSFLKCGIYELSLKMPRDLKDKCLSFLKSDLYI